MVMAEPWPGASGFSDCAAAASASASTAAMMDVLRSMLFSPGCRRRTDSEGELAGKSEEKGQRPRPRAAAPPASRSVRLRGFLGGRMRARVSILITAILFLVSFAAAQDALTPEQRAAIDKAATDALRESGTPSASVAVVKDGQIVYAHAYGNAKLEPPTPATAEMRYS